MISRIFKSRIDWNGTAVEISYEPNWLGISIGGEPVAHLQLRSLDPEGVALPVSGTGYRSCFLGASEVEAHGGPLAFVRAWLDEAATSKVWRDKQERERQGNLF